MHQNSLRLAIFGLVTAFLWGCSRGDGGYSKYEDIIKIKLRDPTSAEFRNEKVRTIWSKEGSRLRIYCAEVNSNNAFGGKTGFIPWIYYISDHSASRDPEVMHHVGAAYDFSNGNTANYYLQCLRPDTERREQDVEMTVSEFGFDERVKAYIDSQIPYISDKSAPD